MGVAHLAWTLATRIKQFQGAELGWSQREYESDSKVIQLAGGSPCLMQHGEVHVLFSCAAMLMHCILTSICVAPAARLPAGATARAFVRRPLPRPGAWPLLARLRA